MESVMQGVQSFPRIAAAAHSHFVQPVTLSVITHCKCKGQRIFHHHRIAAHIGLAADATELMNSGISADVCAILNDDVAGQSGGVGHDHVVADQTIMRDVRLGHQKTVIADPGETPTACCAAMHGDKLANASSAPNFGARFFARKLQILGRKANRDKRKNMGLVPDACLAFDYAVRIYANSFTQLDTVTHDHKGPNVAALSDSSV